MHNMTADAVLKGLFVYQQHLVAFCIPEWKIVQP